MNMNCMKSQDEISDFLPPLDVVVNYPLLKISQDGLDIIYAGTIIVNAKLYPIKVREYLDEGIRKFEFLDADCSLGKRFSGILGDIKNINAGCISTYLKKLVKIIERYHPPLKNHCPTYRKIISEFDEFSKFYIDLKLLEISPNLSSIKVSFADQASREHSIEFGIDYDVTSDIFFFKEYDVPINKNIVDTKSSNLKELYNKFLAYIEELQPFFEFMDMVDANSSVIDPKDCLRKYIYRRILIEKNFSVIITVDPCDINSCPNFAFVGPDRLVNEYQHRIQENLENWDNQECLYVQILHLLSLEGFPKELCNTSISEDLNNGLLKTDTDCSICFSSDLTGNLPDVVCDNKCCGNVYHTDCLFEWLSSIGSRIYFDNIQGPCPNCEKTIYCPIFNL